MDIRRQVGLNVLRLRGELGLSQEALGFACKLDRTYISGVERGVRNPTVLVIAALARGLGVAPAQLFEPPPKR